MDTQDAPTGALMQQVSERSAAIETSLLFFDLEWNELDDEHAETLLAADELASVRHHLRTLRRYRDHQLSEPEERILDRDPGDRRLGLRAPVHRADVGDGGGAARPRRARRR